MSDIQKQVVAALRRLKNLPLELAMSASYRYQSISPTGGDGENGSIDGGDGSIRKDNWLTRPSIFWLLPTATLLHLAGGAITMPSTNVAISLICRSFLSKDTSVSQQSLVVPRYGDVLGVARATNATLSDSALTSSANLSAIVVGDYNPQCAFPEVESAAAMVTLWGNLIASVIGALVSPLWGSVSDRYGRVKVLTACSVLLWFSDILIALIAGMPDSFGLRWVYLSYLVEGISGSFIVFMALCSAYAADCTTTEKRMTALGWFHGSMYFGMAVGPVLGGFIGSIGGEKKPLRTIITAIVMRTLGTLILALFVPESVSQKQSKLSDESVFERLKPSKLLEGLTPPHLGPATKHNIKLFAGMNVIMHGTFMATWSVLILYSEFAFSWTNMESGTFLSVSNVCRTVATGLILPAVIKHYRASHKQEATEDAEESEATQIPSIKPIDLHMPRVSMVLGVTGFVGFALAPNGFLYTVAGAIAAFSVIGIATSEASMTKLVGQGQAGEVLGTLGFLQSIARILGPTAVNAVYSWTAKSNRQLVFWGAAAFFSLSGLLTYFTKPERDPRSDYELARSRGEEDDW